MLLRSEVKLLRSSSTSGRGKKVVVRRFDLIQGESVDPFCASDQDDVEEVHEIGESNNGELGIETRSEVSQWLTIEMFLDTAAKRKQRYVYL